MVASRRRGPSDVDDHASLMQVLAAADEVVAAASAPSASDAQGKNKRKTRETPLEALECGKTQFPSVVAALRFVSYALLVLLTVGPMYVLESISLQTTQLKVLSHISLVPYGGADPRLVEGLGGEDELGIKEVVAVPKGGRRGGRRGGRGGGRDDTEDSYDEVAAEEAYLKRKKRKQAAASKRKDKANAKAPPSTDRDDGSLAPEGERATPGPTTAEDFSFSSATGSRGKLQLHRDEDLETVSWESAIGDAPDKAPEAASGLAMSSVLPWARRTSNWVVLQEGDEPSNDQREAVLDGFAIDQTSYEAPWFRSPFHSRYAHKEKGVRDRITRLAGQTLDKLRKGIPCVPKVCHARPDFFAVEDGIPKIFLVSFPGSGNTWMRSMIRSGTRRFTGSLYEDKKLYSNQGFQGELLSGSDQRTSLVKSHFPMWKVGNPNKFGNFRAAMLVVRSPFDSILAELNRIQSGQSHTGVASNEYLKGDGRTRAAALSNTFTQFVQFWEGLNAATAKTARAVLNEGHGTLHYDSTRLRDVEGLFSYDVRPMRFGEGFPVFTMFYEDFERDYVRALAYMFAFLKLHHQELTPSVYEAVICTMRSQELFTHTKRNTEGQLNPFKDNAAQFCRIFKHAWNEAKWGPCDGRLQKEREVSRRDWQRDFPLPTETCAT